MFCAYENPVFQLCPGNPCFVKNMQEIITIVFLLQPNYDMREQVEIPVLQLKYMGQGEII